MKVRVEWIDGEVREYPNVDEVHAGTDGVLRLYERRTYSGRHVVAELVIANIREWKRSE